VRPFQRHYNSRLAPNGGSELSLRSLPCGEWVLRWFKLLTRWGDSPKMWVSARPCGNASLLGATNGFRQACHAYVDACLALWTQATGRRRLKFPTLLPSPLEKRTFHVLSQPDIWCATDGPLCDWHSLPLAVASSDTERLRQPVNSTLDSRCLLRLPSYRRPDVGVLCPSWTQALRRLLLVTLEMGSRLHSHLSLYTQRYHWTAMPLYIARRTETHGTDRLAVSSERQDP